MRRRIFLLLSLWCGFCSGVGPFKIYGQEPHSYVYRHSGSLPIILSAPHGGKLEIPGVPVREGEGQVKAAGKFVATRDTGTEELAHAVSEAIERRFKKKPYMVVSRVHRKYLDPNRAPELAYEDPDAKPVFDEYHHTLNRYCQDVQKQFRRGLLIDLHGQGVEANTVFRGTHNGKTVALLRERYGEAAHTGQSSLLGLLKGQHWKVFPDPFDQPEHHEFTGGYIVRTYGGDKGPGLDAIQLEFGHNYRSTSTERTETAASLADALAEYARLYLETPAG